MHLDDIMALSKEITEEVVEDYNKGHGIDFIEDNVRRLIINAVPSVES